MIFFIEISFLKSFEKTKDVHNVRKWPNVCSVGLGMFRKAIVKPLGQIEWVLKHSLVRTAKSNI